jgi:hypothetical protein
MNSVSVVTVCDEARSVNFSAGFVWKVFLALLLISVISGVVLSIIGYTYPSVQYIH